MTDVRASTDRDAPVLRSIADRVLDLDGEDAADLPDLLARPVAGRVRLTAEVDGAVVGALVGTVQGDDAHLDLVMVDAPAQRRGAAVALLAEWEAVARAAGTRRLLVGGDLQPYAWPGVDVRYTAAVAFLLRAGYRRRETLYNMDVALTGDAVRRDVADRSEAAGVHVRRGLPSDAEALRDAAGRFSEVWRRETAIALDRPTPSVFVAEREGRIVGFAAHGVHRRAWYGPIATDPSVRGLGVGDALSRSVLADLAAGGVERAQIGWVAEDAIPFYSRTVGARIGRCFWTFEKAA